MLSYSFVFWELFIYFPQYELVARMLLSLSHTLFVICDFYHNQKVWKSNAELSTPHQL